MNVKKEDMNRPECFAKVDPHRITDKHDISCSYSEKAA